MARNTKTEQLTSVQMFSACTDKELAQIARACDELAVEADAVLVEEGAAGEDFFLVGTGEAEVSRGGRHVATLGPGQYFGEMALLDRRPRSATVISETDMTLLVLGQRQFNGVLDAVPALSRKMLAAMATRLREADEKAMAAI
jgi:CRP/FNR family cyclic AMP-dependent transcriptional regulator